MSVINFSSAFCGTFATFGSLHLIPYVHKKNPFSHIIIALFARLKDSFKKESFDSM